MRKRIAITTALVALVALTAVPLALARPGGHGGGRGLGMLGRLVHLQDKLDLSDAQVDQIKAIFTELHKQNDPYREDIRGGLDGVARTLLENPDNVAGAQALLEQRAAAEKAMKANVLSASSKALKVLSADQRAKLGELLERRGEHRERMRR